MSASSLHPASVEDGYMQGFGNSFATEALPGALPAGRNSPQRCPYGLYAEQFSGTAFTAPRAANRRSWLYRILPSTLHGPFRPVDEGGWVSRHVAGATAPEPMRWGPLALPEEPADFVQGLWTMAGNGDPSLQQGCGIHVYAANRPMVDRFVCDADGELLIVPQLGRLKVATELGTLDLSPCELGVVPRGLRFRVELPDGIARGYVCENYGAAFRLPDLGPIGSNGLANPRDFLTPVARFEDLRRPCELLARFQGRLWSATMDHSPLDVVAWHGNCAPCKFDLRRFNAIGSISFDHPDPSIFLVLQSASDTPGVDTIDVVVFPPRVLAMEDTFRPPWFHRNVASEFMGLIHGVYDAKAEGFVPGGCSLHNCMSGHGPDAATVERALAADTSRADRIADTMAFMFETRHPLCVTPFALSAPHRQADYAKCWQTLPRRFDASRR